MGRIDDQRDPPGLQVLGQSGGGTEPTDPDVPDWKGRLSNPSCQR
jgi:hypothetical protein